jgi:cytochrome c oxidase cbb3-type subunit 3
MNPETPAPPPGDDIPLRPHIYDGIQEYDQRLPNWWLYTLYGAIVFSVVFWFSHQVARILPADGAKVDAAMTRIQAAKMVASIDVGNDAKFWEMSRNAVFVDAGRASFTSTCVTCHTAQLTGAVGPNLVDQKWIHGGTPKEIYKTINEGVPAKGMPAWGPVLGAKKSAELVAYILSYHKEGEPVEKQDAWVAITPK